MLIEKDLVIDATHMSKKTRHKFVDCKWIDNNHFIISQREYLKRNPNGRDKIVEFICNRCGKTITYEARAYKETNEGKTYCSKCKISMTVSSEECKERTRKTVQAKYGVDHVLSSLKVRKKIDNTNMERYGVKNPLQRKEIKEKRENTCTKKYGVPVASQSEEVKAKSRETCMERYGVEHFLACKEKRKEMEERSFQKYGVRINSQRPKAKQAMIETNRQKYGYDYTCQVPEIRQKQIDTLNKNRKKNKFKMSSQPARKIAEILESRCEVPMLGYVIDVFVEKDNIDVEFDGGGHDFGVRVFHKMTNEELRRKDYYRAKKFNEHGIKTIRFITKHDLLPDDNKIKKLYEFAKSCLTNKFFVARIYLEKNVFKCGPIRKTLDEIYAL